MIFYDEMRAIVRQVLRNHVEFGDVRGFTAGALDRICSERGWPKDKTRGEVLSARIANEIALAKLSTLVCAGCGRVFGPKNVPKAVWTAHKKACGGRIRINPIPPV